MKKKITFRDIIFLQFVVIVFTVSSIVAKFASGQEVMTFGFFLFYTGCMSISSKSRNGAGS